MEAIRRHGVVGWVASENTPPVGPEGLAGGVYMEVGQAMFDGFHVATAQITTRSRAMIRIAHSG